ncbi:M23 family metallopeptidase [Alteribacillus bidgolensis]|uniref:Peptidase family M23 n=1 Tax=Alteribacillus bidgolensis TaxID=930129 RepID=A0A1G8RBH5_9BACI|nr:M23 family metallopeptidase [Alteribacillus bidgolensis]SDJ14281.1 Peptidase family M23 [Alteribacillus bidgolensis]
MKKISLIFCTLIMTIFIFPIQEITAAEKSSEDIYKERMSLYKDMEAITQVPWYWLAGVDAYERGLRRARKDRDESQGVINIYFSPKEWAGPLNPDLDSEDPFANSLFEGIGLDGNENGKASLNEDADVLYTFANYLSGYGHDDDNIQIGLWEYYHRDQAINIITGHARIFRKYNRIDLDDEHAFPVPLNYNYSYRSTWGDKRGWGGRRIHEGTDIFADYRTPVRATSHGIIELKGWNKFGGWRIGIRDLSNTYNYYAHLSGFEDGVEKGDIVAPGDVIGYVGSSGYGKPGTEGKFPPHLHYGMYRDNGYSEWSFDPYSSLKSWEKQDRK